MRLCLEIAQSESPISITTTTIIIIILPAVPDPVFSDSLIFPQPRLGPDSFPSRTDAFLQLHSSSCSHEQKSEAPRNFSVPGSCFPLAFLTASKFFFSFPRDLCKFRTRTRKEKKVALLTLPASQILGGLSPGHTFAFRQNAAAAQAEQRGESEPLHQTGRHRASEAPGAAPSIHSSEPVIRFTPPKKTLKRGSKVSLFQPQSKEFLPGLGNFDSSSSWVICSSERCAGTHAPGRSDVIRRQDRCASGGSGTYHPLQQIEILLLYWYFTAVVHSRDTCTYFNGLFFSPL